MPHEDPITLKGKVKADIAIIGGGFVGLWTAIAIKELEPSANVVVLEMGRCGQGASGMNGGMLMTWWPKIIALCKLCGQGDALWLAEKTTQSIETLAAFLDSHNIDAELVTSGWLWTATSPLHIGSWKNVQEKTRLLSNREIFQDISKEELCWRTGSSAHLAGVYEKMNGTLHPGKMGSGLAQIARKLGVAIFENSRVKKFDKSQPVKLYTAHGVVETTKVVITNNAWAASIPNLSPYFVCVTSAAFATIPIPDRLKDIGWTGGESITDSQTTVNYYRTTKDGRIVFGKGGGKLLYTGAPRQAAFNDLIGAKNAINDFRRVYPNLADVPVDSAWSGPIDRTYDSLPLIGRITKSPHISYGVGWSGNGVNTSRIGGRILAGLALDIQDRWTENGLVGRTAKRFPPEPIRYIGGNMVRAATARKDKSEINGHKGYAFDRILSSLAPSGLEDK
ncbi:MAG: amine oxidase [Alphaproteobacteria bacterium]|nr:MAG: amine oxidase [Alphaproteobacteria bacterium]